MSRSTGLSYAKADLLQGTLILKVVTHRHIHGYRISPRIRQISRDKVQVQQGLLYPALHRLEQRGWLSATWSKSETGRPAMFHKLSAKGRKQLTAEEQTWLRLTDAISLILQTTASEWICVG
jgi:transcriptional regulator